MQNLSRRNFFKLGAGVLAGAALFDLTGLNHKAFAQKITPSNFKINPIKLSDLPPATKAPLNSQLVNNAYDYIISSVEKITDNKLCQQTLDLIKDTRPKFMQLYTSSTDVTNIYNELANKGLIDTSIISPEQLKIHKISFLLQAVAMLAIILILEDFQLIQQPIYLFLKA